MAVPATDDPPFFENFVPLRNFLEGRPDYQNTCFIASALNLSTWLPVIVEELGIQQAEGVEWTEARWKQSIVNVRSRWDGKYQWTPESHGQDDLSLIHI